MIKISINLAIIIAFVFAIGIVSADSYSLICLTNGQSVDLGQLCNPGMRKITAPNPGSEDVCLHNLDNGKRCSTHLSTCYSSGIPCSLLTDNETVDSEPPILTITNPIQDKIYNSKTIQLILYTGETTDIAYTDLNTGNGKWTNVCSDCYTYNKPRSFKEGLNNLMFRARDRNGAIGYNNTSFYIDSKKPRISRTSPLKGFANEEFTVQFDEINPLNLTLNYGNLISGFKSKQLDLNSEECILDKKSTCTTSVSLTEYNGEQIQYWFNLSDIAQTSVGSKVSKLDVDLSSPVLISTNSTVAGRSWKISMNISEPHFDSVKYIDNSASRPTWKTLCSTLKNGICTKKISLTTGSHSIDIQINDEAGNSIATNINVEIP